MNNDPIEIPLSKTKLTLLLFAGMAFVAIGIWFIIQPATFRAPFMNHPFIVQSVGAVSVLFFGLVSVWIVKKLGDKRPGLIITNEGITDQSSGIPAGFIPWGDVTDIQQINIFNQKLLLIKVHNPSSYINRHTSAVKRKAAAFNLKNYDSPICITANSLKCNTTELKATLEKRLTAYRGY